MTTAAAPFGITTGANRIIPQYDSTRRSQRGSSSEGNAVFLLLISFPLFSFIVPSSCRQQFNSNYIRLSI